MKLTFEIDSNDLNDVIDALNILSRFAPAKYTNVIECQEKSTPLLEEKVEENDLISEYEEKIKSLEEEIKSLKENSFNEDTNGIDMNFDVLMDEDFSDNTSSEEIEKLKCQVEELEEEITSLKKENDELKSVDNSVDLSSYIEKSVHERILADVNKELEIHKNRSDKNFQKNKDLRMSIDTLAKEKKELELKLQSVENSTSVSNEDIEELNCIISKLKEDVEFHKGRSDRNYQNLNSAKDEIKSLKQENQELSEKIKENVNNNNNVNVDEIKADFMEQKSKYETQINELKLLCDKAENELAVIRSKFKEEDSKELNELRTIRKTICSNDRGRAFWNGIESQVQAKLGSK